MNALNVATAVIRTTSMHATSVVKPITRLAADVVADVERGGRAVAERRHAPIG